MDLQARVERLPAQTARQLGGVALLIAVLIGLLQWGKVTPLRQFDEFIYDQLLRLTAVPVSGSAAMLIDIDDNSLSEIGQWPWPRYKLAQLLERAAAGRPAAIATDILFPEADRTALNAQQEAYRKEFGIELGFDQVPKALLDNDVYLGAVMAEYGVVGAVHFLFDQENVSGVSLAPPPGIALQGEVDLLQLDQAPGILHNTFKIQSQLKSNGFVTIEPDPDGKTRRVPLLMRYHDQVYPHLLLAGLMKIVGTDRLTVGHDGFGPVLKIGPHTIPVAKDGSMLLRYRQAGAKYPTFSALDVLRSERPIPAMSGRAVYVGSSAAGLNDLINTPTETQFSGLNLYAVGLDNILGQNTLREPAWWGEAAFLSSVVCAILVAWLFINSSSMPVLLAGSTGLIVILLGASIWMLQHLGVYLSPSSGLASVMVCFTWLSLTRLTIERKQALRWLELVSNTQRVAIESMAAVAETRDPETGGHIKRTQSYVRALGEELAREGKHLDILTPEYIEWLYLSAPLHDIGKVGIHDSILLKPGKLDDAEFHQMKQHARFGHEIIMATSKSIKGDNFLRVAGEIASCHHEKWNGAGYPVGLAGEAIPLSARLMAVADVYDALVSKRCYKPAFSHQDAREYLLKKSGEDFDPTVIAAFVAIEDKIIGIAERYKDDGAIEEGEE